MIIAASEENVTIKVTDNATAAASSSPTYGVTVNVQALGTRHRAGTAAGTLYAKHLGGSMNFVPMEGHGTDSYVIFNRLPHQNQEKLLRVLEGNALPEDPTEGRAERPVQGKWRQAIRLFDAQKRSAVSPQS